MSNQTQMILASVFIAMYLILTAFSLWATISEYMSKNTDRRQFRFNLIWLVILIITSIEFINLIFYFRSI